MQFCLTLLTAVLLVISSASPSLADPSETRRAQAIATLSRLQDQLGLVAHELIVQGSADGRATFPIVARLRYASVPLFDFDSSRLTPQAEQAISELARLFASDKDLASIVVVGHTDSTGPVAYNYNLAVERSRAVANSLLLKGVQPGIISVIGLGPDYPANSNSTEQTRSLNRRVEFWLPAISRG